VQITVSIHILTKGHLGAVHENDPLLLLLLGFKISNGCMRITSDAVTDPAMESAGHPRMGA